MSSIPELVTMIRLWIVAAEFLLEHSILAALGQSMRSRWVITSNPILAAMETVMNWFACVNLAMTRHHLVAHALNFA